MLEQYSDHKSSAVFNGSLNESPKVRERRSFDHPALKRIITSSPEMQKVFSIIEKVSGTNSTVLVLGESGTGKELIARAIHEMSGSKGMFVPVNCAAIPENLLESELFGHEKGAFTGAISSKAGRFLLADGGTIFLDEIGEMPLALQCKLLRVLQEKVIEPVGGVKPRPINVRVIAATNSQLREQVRNGTFREDLFYRLQVVPIELPSLKARGNDAALLVSHFARKFAAAHDRRPLVFSEEAQQIIQRYGWPGNVRELENLIERLSILVDSDAVYPSDLPEHIIHNESISGADNLTARLPESGLDFNSAVEQFENTLILQALERTGWNKKAAARLLGLNRTTLVEKIKKKGLEKSADSQVLPFEVNY